MPRAFRHFYSLRARPLPRHFYCPAVRRVSASVTVRQGLLANYQGFSIFGPVQPLRRIVPQAVSPSWFRRIQAMPGALCPAPGFSLLPLSTHPLSFVSYFSPRILPRKRVKNGPCSKHGPFSALERRGGIRRPNRCVHFLRYQFYHGKRAMGGNLIFPGSDSAK